MASKLFLPAETQRYLRDRDRQWRTDFATRALTTIFSITSFVIFAVTVHQSTSEYGGNDWTDGFPIGPLLIALLYNPFIVFFTLYYRHGRTVHPGWSLTADLFIWGLGFCAFIFSVGDGWFWWWPPLSPMKDDGFVPCVAFNYWSKDCNSLIYKLGKQEIAANVFLGLVLISHFMLFIRDCVMTRRWRKSDKQAKATRPDIELQYHRSPEEHQREAPPAYTPKQPGAPRQ